MGIYYHINHLFEKEEALVTYLLLCFSRAHDFFPLAFGAPKLIRLVF